MMFNNYRHLQERLHRVVVPLAPLVRLLQIKPQSIQNSVFSSGQ